MECARNGNLTRVTDPGNTITQYTYDLRNRPATRTDPFAKVDTWHWDGNGNLEYTIDRRNQRTDFQYDALDRRTLATFADASTITYGYSFTGVEAQVVLTDSLSGAITQRFDGLDRLKYEITPQGRVDYAYDTASRRTSMTVQGQSAITYGYDNANRLTSITRAGQAIALTYDQAERRTKIVYPGGAEQRWLYARPSARPSGIEYWQGTTRTDTLTDTWDGDGRPIARAGTGSFPATGLPNATTANYDRNRLTNLNGTAWTYDDQGNLTGDGTHTYLWDARNRLTEIKAGATTVAAFAYDALDRRTTRTVSGNATSYLHDGLTPAQEIRGASSTKLIAGPGIDDYLGRVEPTRTRYYLTDTLGSTAALADTAGQKVTSYTMSPTARPRWQGKARTTRSSTPAGRTTRPGSSTTGQGTTIQLRSAS